MNGIIDYAGLFPPAELPLDKAIHNYANYRKDNDSWMLSRFVIPASKLSELNSYADELFTADNPFKFSVLGKKTKTIAGFKEEINAVINFCTIFCEKHADLVATDMMEVRLPHEALRLQRVGLIKNLLNDTAEQFQASPLAPSTIFYEGLFDEKWRSNNKAIIQALAIHNNEFPSDDNYQSSNYKIRCGGVKKELFPSVEQVAFILNCTRDHGVSLKATAGLHHPVRHYAAEVETKMYGFLNVFGGAMMAHTNNFNEEKLQEILREENPQQFQFTDKAFGWKGKTVSTRQIKSLRKNMLLSYGSCSFDEPREDLQKLELL